MAGGAWSETEAAFERLIDEVPEPFDPATIANARDLIRYLQGRCVAPDHFGKGYWATFSFTWGDCEIEVFSDQLDLYRWHEQETEIMAFSRRPGEPFPEEFVSRLPMLKP